MLRSFATYERMMSDQTGACRRQRRATTCFVGAAIVSFLLAGCGGEGYTTVPVSGRVTLDGSPLADVGLVFVPIAKDKDNPNVGPGSLGKTDAQGRFTLQTVNGEDGAVPTEHVVRMSLAPDASEVQSPDDAVPEAPVASPRSSRKLSLPRHARDGSLHFQVPSEGTDQADFDLVSKEAAETLPR